MVCLCRLLIMRVSADRIEAVHGREAGEAGERGTDSSEDGEQSIKRARLSTYQEETWSSVESNGYQRPLSRSGVAGSFLDGRRERGRGQGGKKKRAREEEGGGGGQLSCFYGMEGSPGVASWRSQLRPSAAAKRYPTYFTRVASRLRLEHGCGSANSV